MGRFKMGRKTSPTKLTLAYQSSSSLVSLTDLFSIYLNYPSINLSIYVSICLSIYLSIQPLQPIHLSMALSPCGHWLFFQVSNLYTVGRTPWTEDQLVARPLPAHRTTQRQNKRTHTSMPRVGFRAMIPVFELAKTLHGLDRAATVLCDVGSGITTGWYPVEGVVRLRVGLSNWKTGKIQQRTVGT
jgi:hypothetical protein